MHSGLGVRPELFDDIFERRPKLAFFEAHSENYFGDSIARTKLRELRNDYAISLHGVGLSLGRADNLNGNHLKQLKNLVDEIDPILVSEHLAWSAYSHRHLPDLLPLPLTEQSLNIMCQHVEQMQDVLGRKIHVENPSNYLLFDQLQIPEPEFLNTLATRTGCGLLVDVNNIFVSSTNLGRDANAYMELLNSEHIGQYHLAGHTQVDRHGESVLIDTHNQKVRSQVWNLFERTIQKHGARATLIEWDSDFPDFSVLLSECQKAEDILAKKSFTPGVEQTNSQRSASAGQTTEITQTCELELSDLQQHLLDRLLTLEDKIDPVIDSHKHRLWIYQNNVFAANRSYLQEVYPAVHGLVGDTFFKQMAQVFCQNSPPSEGNVYLFGEGFDSVIAEFEALQDMPYLADLMSFEWSLHKAYFASLDTCIDTSKIDQSELLSMPIRFNPSVVVINSMYPIYEIHRQSLPEYSGEVGINLDQSQDSLLVYKQAHSAKSRVLSDDEALFLDGLAKSENILQAIEQLHGSIPAETLSASLALLFELRLLSTE